MKIERTIAATFDNEANLLDALNDLSRLGVQEEKVGILMSSITSDKKFTLQPKTKVAEGLATGSTLGGVIGAVLGGLTALSVPFTAGVSLMAAGPLFSALAGLGIGSGVGGLSGAIIGLGFEEYVGELVEKGLAKGSILVAVTIDEDIVDSVKQVLTNNGGTNISVARSIKAGNPSMQRPMLDDTL